MRRTYGRDRVEFGRVLAFSDGLFAIAMTLLIVAIGVPDIPMGILGQRWKPEGADEQLFGSGD